MPVQIVLLDAIKSGEFGPVRLGMTKQEVRRALGAPDDELLSSRGQRESPGWKYGDIEIFFDPPDWTVECVFADDFDVLDGGTRLQIDSGRVRGGMSWDEVVNTLEDLGVAFSEVPAPSPGVRWLRTQSDVTLAVVIEPEKFGPCAGLNALSWKAG